MTQPPWPPPPPPAGGYPRFEPPPAGGYPQFEPPQSGPEPRGPVSFVPPASGARPPAGPAPPPRPARRGRGRLGLVAGLVVGTLAVGGVVVSGLLDQRQLDREAAASVSPRPTRTPPPAASSTEIGFTSSEGAGVLRVNSHRWQGSTLVVNLTVTAVEGELTYSFGAFGPSGGYVDADSGRAPEPELGFGTASPGDPVTGNVALPVGSRGPVTLTLSNDYGESVTALRVED